jgi:hypothetical protein
MRPTFLKVSTTHFEILIHIFKGLVFISVDICSVSSYAARKHTIFLFMFSTSIILYGLIS